MSTDKTSLLEKAMAFMNGLRLLPEKVLAISATLPHDMLCQIFKGLVNNSMIGYLKQSLALGFSGSGADRPW